MFSFNELDEKRLQEKIALIVEEEPPRQRKRRSRKEIANRMVEFNQVINAIHINTHPAQKKLLKEITGGCDILTVRRWLITAHTEAVLK